MSKQRRGKRAANISYFLYSLSPLHSLCLPQGHSPLSTFVHLCRWCNSKESACEFRRHRRCRFNPWIRNIPLEYKMATQPSVLARKNPMDRGAWQPIVRGVTKSQTWLTEHAHSHAPQDLKQSQAPDNNFVSICCMDEQVNSSRLII